MKITAGALLGVALVSGFLGSQAAQASYLVNGDLEASSASLLSSDNLIHASSTLNSGALPGWTLGGDSIDIVPTSYWQNTSGGYSVDLVGTSGLGSISQTVTGLTAGEHYTLSFDFTPNPENYTQEGSSTKILQVSATNTSMTPTDYSGTTGSRTDTNMQYTHEVLNFTANSSSTTLTMAALMPTGLPASFQPNTVWCGPVIDNLDLELAGSTPVTPVDPPPGGGGGGNSAVPEPATPLLIGLAVTALMLRKRRFAR